MSGEVMDDAAVFTPQALGDAEVFAPVEFLQGAQPGAATWFGAASGDDLAGQYALIDAADVRAAHDVDLREVPEHQEQLVTEPKDRATYEQQLQTMVRDFDPAQLGAGDGVDTGAPVVGPDGLVEAGNARAVALQRIYRADGQKAADYRDFLRENAAQFGLQPEQVDAVAKPMLVRVRATPTDRAGVGRPLDDVDIAPDLAGAAGEIRQALADEGELEIQDADDLSDDTRLILTYLAEHAEDPNLISAVTAATRSDDGTSPDAERPDAAQDEAADQPAGGEPQAAPGGGLPDQIAGPAAAEVAGEPAEDWRAFPDELGSLGIPRSEMPQIQAAHRGALVNFLTARGITHEQQVVSPEELRPTQEAWEVGRVKKAAGRTEGDRAILVSADGHVLDGHHQWLDALADEEPVRVIRFSAPIGDLLLQAREFPSAETSESVS